MFSFATVGVERAALARLAAAGVEGDGRRVRSAPASHDKKIALCQVASSFFPLCRVLCLRLHGGLQRCSRWAGIDSPPSSLPVVQSPPPSPPRRPATTQLMRAPRHEGGWIRSGGGPQRSRRRRRQRTSGWRPHWHANRYVFIVAPLANFVHSLPMHILRRVPPSSPSLPLLPLLPLPPHPSHTPLPQPPLLSYPLLLQGSREGSRVPFPCLPILFTLCPRLCFFPVRGRGKTLMWRRGSCRSGCGTRNSGQGLRRCGVDEGVVSGWGTEE